MENKNIYLIIDPSPAFLRSKVQDIFQLWGFARTNVKELTEWSQIPSTPSLFGDLLMTHLDLTSKNSIKKFADLISQRKMQNFFSGNWFGNGVIITCLTSVGTKKIEKLVTASGGRVIKKEKSANRKKELLSLLNLSSSIKTAIDDFVGEDYDLMLSFVNAISKESKAKQKELSLVDAFSYFPPVPGSVPPWDYLNALINGSTTNSISLFERTLKNTVILIPLVFITKKMQSIYRIRMALAEGLTRDKEIAEAIGESPSWEITNNLKVAKRISILNAERIALISTELESDLKGGSNVNAKTEFIVAITKIGMLLGNQK